ncbi:uncharacterized protein LOC106084516 [Stomoxys calcitrans]|uniref:uncharacterized protein LOC106084516 n=1 Tax=Stomoxys calcitrans TaxID=35570 RepID=UPI0027E31A9F|nr:uncharacterized protein LOC106084516 [Stomoxys calcitrans]
MAEAPKIIDLPSVIEPHLDGGKLISYTSRYLTKAGENYGSIMLAVIANIQKPSGEIEDLPLVAKLPPITNDFFWKLFKPERTCLTEIVFYRYLSAALRSMQLEEGIEESQLFDGFPQYYGSRISLNPDTELVDRDAVLVQENLQTMGFKAGNRHVMFNLEQTKFVLLETAKYHALPLALRIKKPEEFNQHIRPYIRRFNMNGDMPAEVKEQLNSDLFTEVALATNNNDNYVNRFRKLMKDYDDFFYKPDAEDGLYTTVAHCDLWINNLMLKYDENGAPCKIKFVDFQIAQYESVAHDIIFFLFSSVEIPALENHMDELLLLYYKAFIDCLKSVNVPTDEYSFVGFMKEIHRCAPIEICHAVFMAKIILADNSTMPDDYKDMGMDVMSKNLGGKEISEKIGHIIRLAEKYKFLFDN